MEFIRETLESLLHVNLALFHVRSLSYGIQPLRCFGVFYILATLLYFSRFKASECDGDSF